MFHPPSRALPRAPTREPAHGGPGCASFELSAKALWSPSLPPGARSRHELEIARRDRRSVAGDKADGDRRTVAASTGDPRRLVGDVAVSPLHQREEADTELSPLLREVVLEALGALAVADPIEDAF